MDRQVPCCSFCGKTQGQVRLVAGPSHVYICHLCVALCNEILAHDASPERRPGDGPPTAPDRWIQAEFNSSRRAARPETADR